MYANWDVVCNLLHHNYIYLTDTSPDRQTVFSEHLHSPTNPTVPA